jgi:hypothetical protein
MNGWRSGAPDVAVEFWGCARWPECDFRDVLPKRLAAPQIALEAAPSVGFKVTVPDWANSLVISTKEFMAGSPFRFWDTLHSIQPLFVYGIFDPSPTLIPKCAITSSVKKHSNKGPFTKPYTI